MRRAGLSQVAQGADTGSPQSDAADEQRLPEARR